MNFLSKLGLAIAKGLAIVSGIGSQSILAKVDSELNQLGIVIANVEALKTSLGLTGAQRLIAAAPQVEQIILASSLMAGKKIADEAKFRAAIIGLASNMADLLSSLHESSVSIDSKT